MHDSNLANVTKESAQLDFSHGLHDVCNAVLPPGCSSDTMDQNDNCLLLCHLEPSGDQPLA